MNMYRHGREQGSVNGSLIAIIALSILFMGAGATAIWAYMNYVEQKTNVDAKISLQVAAAKKEQADSDDAKFIEREKEPNRHFVGPDDYGRLTFDYPKTWSVYEARDVSQQGGTYQAFLNPVTVPPVSDKQQYAIRVTIEERDYDQVIQSYQERVKANKLTSSATSSHGKAGTRFDGLFNESIRGSAVVYKIRDKTATIRTDADTFKPDFEKIITTIEFNS